MTKKRPARTDLFHQHCESMRKMQRAALDQIERVVMGASSLPAAQSEVRLILDAMHRAHMDAETRFRKKIASH
jgi:hypothetical protein